MVDGNQFREAMQKAVKKDQRKEELKSKLIDPRYRGYQRGLLSPEKSYSMQLFRRISEKAWLINVVIGHIIDKTIPYMRPESARGSRYFDIELKDPDKKLTDKLKKRAMEIQEFFLQTGWDRLNPDREDDLPHYTKKILRDLLTLDQVAAEKVKTYSGDMHSFYAIDAATILRCTEEGYEGDDKIKFVQMIQSQIVSTYHAGQIIFQFDNPRTDVLHYGYGYSKIEQCVGLIISSINTFAFNAGAFTEDKLPRGMLLLNGDIGMEEVEEIEDYLIDVMGPDGISGATGRWGIPIIPSGKSGDKSSISWQPMGNSNQEMQYSRWQDFLNMGIAAIYGVDIESTGIKNEKGAKIMESGSAEAHKYSDDKGIGNALTFLERHFQTILDEIDPQFRFVFHGFEQDDAKEMRDATKSELESSKSLNELRLEKDLKPVPFKFADVPGLQNPQYLQAYQAEVGGGEEEGAPGGDPGAEDQGMDEFDQGFDDFEKSMNNDIITIVI